MAIWVMRILNYIFLMFVGVVFYALAMANRDLVSLRLVPEEIAQYFSIPPAISLPVFIPVYGGVIVGILIGFIWEWIREYHYRSDLSRRKRRIKKLESDVITLKSQQNNDKDEILALLE